MLKIRIMQTSGIFQIKIISKAALRGERKVEKSTVLLKYF